MCLDSLADGSSVKYRRGGVEQRASAKALRGDEAQTRLAASRPSVPRRICSLVEDTLGDYAGYCILKSTRTKIGRYIPNLSCVFATPSRLGPRTSTGYTASVSVSYAPSSLIANRLAAGIAPRETIICTGISKSTLLFKQKGLLGTVFTIQKSQAAAKTVSASRLLNLRRNTVQMQSKMVFRLQSGLLLD